MIFGVIMALSLPIQLTPDLQKPEISITTNWRSATPEEVESEIIEPQESALKGLSGVESMLSEASFGSAVVRLTFELEHNLERGLIDVLNRLNSVSSYPFDADEPILNTVGESTRPIAWFLVTPLPGNTRDIESYRRFIEDNLKEPIERISGISLSEVRGGLDQEIQVVIDPHKAANYRVLAPEAMLKVAKNENASGGLKDSGKRSYTIRYSGELKPAKLDSMILKWQEGQAIRLRDVAKVKPTFADRKSFVMTNEGRSIALNAYREPNVNVIQVMQHLKNKVQEINENVLRPAGLVIDQAYDETIYIDNAMELLASNLLLGILLAISVLWLFMRNIRSTLIVSLSVPLSLFTALIVLELGGRTLNVISLAALAFAVGMVLDSSIIAIENISRLRASGRSIFDSALQGVAQVQGALIASTITTVAIFLPIVLLKGEAGKLFGDLAIGLSTAILASLFASLIIVPGMSNRWFGKTSVRDPFEKIWEKLTIGIMRFTNGRKRRVVIVTVLLLVPSVMTYTWLPKADYLPSGNRDLVFGYVLSPPGTNLETMEKEMGETVIRKIKPYLSGEAEPKIERYFFVAFPSGAFIGARAVDPEKTAQLVPLVNEIFADFPDTLAFARRASLFSQGNTRAIDINLRSRDIDALLAAGRAGYGVVQQVLPGARVRPRPGLELASPQLLVTPQEERIAEVGWDRERVGMLIRSLGEGQYITDYFDGDRKLNVVSRIKNWDTLEEMQALPFWTPEGGAVPLGELVHVERNAGPSNIRRLDRRRTITLEVIAPQQLSLEETLETIKSKVEPVLRPILPPDGQVSYGGGADKLTEALSSLSATFILAVVVLYLLISVLFRSFTDSILMLLSLPLATVGGVLFLRWVNLFTFQAMDILTMIGFVILLGLVVNNAILLVHQTRQAERNGLNRDDAVRQAVRLRLRPIMMSTLTSLFGMLPLLLVPGSGSELYRGMSAVIVGGLSVSTVFTLILLPAMLRFGNAPARQNSVEVGGTSL